MVEICVVRCFSCETFQGQQVKKGKKWTCKVCGEKQSFKKIFAQGNGKECRHVVQKLNMMKGSLEQEALEEEYVENSGEVLCFEEEATNEFFVRRKESKWEKFIGEKKASINTNIVEVEDGNFDDNDHSFTTERMFLINAIVIK
ncbi:MRN complex-interacting protein-like [Xenia sp. Carnegie-2017]|uniref:MRN complex-interacting protein-like n=1 Tax=Xenia sp. Carnegie-2017 TaxID=2897299 RepID=UPI001F04CDA0|nr:MRN complex-interacting protein-like [Xenia sp. Carnegie-2017]